MLEPFDTIEAHHFLDFGTASLIEPTIAIATAPALPVFDLERMWHRGRFRPSLLADSPELSELGARNTRMKVCRYCPMFARLRA